MLDLAVAFALLLPLAGAVSAGSPPAPRKAALDADFELGVGEEAQLEEIGVRLRFVGVPADSRCPVDVVCVWEGDATIQVELRRNGEPKELRELHTSRRGGAPPVYAGCELRVSNLVPQPRSGQPIAASAYRATLRVVRAPAAR